MISALSYYCLGRLMQEFLPHVLVNNSLHLAQDLGRAARIITVETKPGEPIRVPDVIGQEPVGPEILAAFKPGMERIRKEVIKLQLKSSYATLERMLKNLGKSDYTHRALADDAEELHGRLVDELKYTSWFALWGEAEERYRADQLFGKQVAENFAGAAEDIAEAGKCLALDRGTACVMHLQRVLECGLDVLGKTVGVAKPLRDWGKYVTEIAAELERRFKASGARTPDEQFYAEAHVTYDAIRRAWRNPSMHFDKTYTLDHAADIFNSVRSFMKHLATRLHE